MVDLESAFGGQEKAPREVDVPVNILKDVTETYLTTLTKIINSSIEQNEVPNNLKLSDVLFIFKKKHTVNNENYKHERLLLHLSKVFERLL